MKAHLMKAFLGGGIFLLVYLSIFHYTSVHEAGIVKNVITGELKLDTPGVHFTAPWVMVAKIDNRPQKVCVTSHARIIACRMSRFVPEYFQELVDREGFRYYWWDNRISFNFGYDDEYRGDRDLIRGYAFSNEKVNFIETKTE